jgi:hypothetical protein
MRKEECAMSTKRTEWDYIVLRMPDEDMNTVGLQKLLRDKGSSYWELAWIVHTPEGYLLAFKRPWIARVKADE